MTGRRAETETGFSTGMPQIATSDEAFCLFGSSSPFRMDLTPFGKEAPSWLGIAAVAIREAVEGNSELAEASRQRSLWHKVVIAMSGRCGRIAVPRVQNPLLSDMVLEALIGLCRRDNERGAVSIVRKLVPPNNVFVVRVEWASDEDVALVACENLRRGVVFMEHDEPAMPELVGRKLGVFYVDPAHRAAEADFPKNAAAAGVIDGLLRAAESSTHQRLQCFAARGMAVYDKDRIGERIYGQLRDASKRAALKLLGDETLDEVSEAADWFNFRLRWFPDEGMAGRWAKAPLNEQPRLELVTADEEDESLNELRQTLNAALSRLPPDFESRRNGLAAVGDFTRQRIAEAMEPVLNARAAALPQATYEDKKALAKWINAELRRFGLALKSDRTNRPCILVGNPGGTPGEGRFMLQYADEKGKLHNPLTSVTLPRLELTLDDLSRASYGPAKGRGR